MSEDKVIIYKYSYIFLIAGLDLPDPIKVSEIEELYDICLDVEMSINSMVKYHPFVNP